MKFLIYQDWTELFQALPDDKQLELYQILFTFDGEKFSRGSTDKQVNVLLKFVLPKMVKDHAKWLEKKKRAEKLNQARRAKANDVDNDIVNDIDSDIAGITTTTTITTPITNTTGKKFKFSADGIDYQGIIEDKDLFNKLSLSKDFKLLNVTAYNNKEYSRFEATNNLNKIFFNLWHDNKLIDNK